MKRATLVICLILTSSICLQGQTVDWRFGFEYNESEPNLLFGINEASHDTLLSRLSSVTASQEVRGGVNVNGSGWTAMQDSGGAPIDFSNTDGWVNRFQDDGFEFIFYLTSTAQWAFRQNPDCIPTLPTFYAECAPDSAHWDDWYDYVYAVVERYDGDGVDDMPGLVIPIRFYVMHQEVYYSGNGMGDIDEQNGNGFWHDNMTNLIKLHEVAYQAMQDADPGGVSKLVGSGGWFFDLYGDFPDYPQTLGPVVQSRLSGNNLRGAVYTAGWDSLTLLLDRLGDNSQGQICDYVGWHPHMGWKSSDQSLKYLREHIGGKPIFVDDMWSAMLTTTAPENGFTQFIGGDSIEGDFPNATIASYQVLIDSLNTGDSIAHNFFNAKTARDAVKCFATVFGEGAERICFTMANDFNQGNFILWPISGPWRYSGMTASVRDNYLPKPALSTMKLMVDLLHDFTSVEQVPVSNNPYTRVYRFNRPRGTSCFVAWSESGWNPPDPSVPNGETVTIPVISDTLRVHHIITKAGVKDHVTELKTPTLPAQFTIQLGFEPVFIEETDTLVTGLDGFMENGRIVLEVYPNPATESVTLSFSIPGPQNLLGLQDLTGLPSIVVRDIIGRVILTKNPGHLKKGEQTHIMSLPDMAKGVYVIEIRVGSRILGAEKLVIP